MKIVSFILLLALTYPVLAFELATKITQEGNAAKLETIGYAKVNLLKQTVSLKGPIVATGTLDVKGTANIIMWSKVDGVYYFSKLPGLQNVRDTKKLSFTIPFNAAEKKVTEVIVEIELLSAGSIVISGFNVQNK
jgi:hypothetical protein